MKKKIKNNINKFLSYYIIGIMLFLLICVVSIKLINDYNSYKISENDFTIYDSYIKDAYNINPNLFKFDENNIAIVKMDELLTVTNGIDTIYFGVIPIDRNQNQCVGYFVIRKVMDEIEIDSSHLCDMIDY